MALPRGFQALIAAQFVSALADNALLIVAIALLAADGWPLWWAPLLKFSFTLAYVLLAPGVGVLADAWPKARMMMAMNGVKVLGVLGLALHTHPLLALAVVGVGAAAYAPAKYGLVTELVGPRQLVAANGWIEVTTVCAVLAGTALGGFLVSPFVAAWALALRPGLPPLTLALWLLLGGYGLAALLNLGIPDSGARYPRGAMHPWALVQSFWRENRCLWRDRDGGLSMAVTTLFWGAAAVLQFAVLRWAIDVLGFTLDRAAYLQGTVAVGIVTGAALAGRWVSLHRATQVLPLGVALGLLVPAVSLVQSWQMAVPLLLLVGVLGGALVVPLNALLQHRGHQLLTAGRSIAVQNFNENASVLVTLAIYAALLAVDVDIRTLMSGLGVWVAAVVAWLWLHSRRQRRRLARA
jgi:MFS family permease